MTAKGLFIVVISMAIVSGNPQGLSGMHIVHALAQLALLVAIALHF
jgi:hypothetical protein